MAKLEFVVFLLIKSVNCAFFDLTDVDDPLSLFWKHPKDFSIPLTNSPCIVPVSSGSVVTGLCKHKTLCLLSGGQVHSNGNCGSFLTCCTKSTTCSQRTKAKVSYFTGETSKFASLRDCNYIIEVQDTVCQVRLDFELFQLSPSTIISTENVNVFQTVCANNYMTVTPEIRNISRFCGNNDGQHVYIHLNTEREVNLHIHMPDINPTTNPISRWRIRVTQLECPTEENFFRKFNIFSSRQDLPLLAPIGVTQYFTEPVGRIRSFGYNGGESSYISGLHYAIGFRRTPSVNCIRYTINKLTLRDNLDSTNPQCLDYLFVPEFKGITDSSWTGPEICATESTDSQQVFYSDAPGPFYLYFYSQPTFTMSGATDNTIYAFDIQYEIRNCY